MANVTCSFDTLPDLIADIPGGAPLRQALQAAADACRSRFGASMRFVDLAGPRWAYLAGARGDFPSTRPVCRERLTDAVGLVTDIREQVPDQVWLLTIRALRDLINGSQ